MPTTRKKVIKTVYKDDDESEDGVGDFSDSGSEAHISEETNSEDDDETEQMSDEDFVEKKTKKKSSKAVAPRKPISLKTLISKVNKQSPEDSAVLISVKDLTEEDKLLPAILNLSESDSSDDETTNKPARKIPPTAVPSTSIVPEIDPGSEQKNDAEYKDVWSQNYQDNSEDIAKKAFMELQQHNSKIEETKASIDSYISKQSVVETNVKDLLALGEEVLPEESPIKKKSRIKKTKIESDSEVEDWEEVKESKSIPQQGLQLFVEFPDGVRKKKKAVDVEMMMKRKLNRVKKEYQVYMHKVHVLCWLGHGNYVSRILNNQEIMAATLSLVPSKECYPGERVDLKYIAQITSWFKEKLTLKQDPNEDKFKPKAPPLTETLLSQIKRKVATTKKYRVFIFVALLRALGLQCRVIFNFVTLPLKPPTSELCSLSTKPTDKTKDDKGKKISSKKKTTSVMSKTKSKENVAQLDGNCDVGLVKDIINIIQLDGSNDDLTPKSRPLRSTRANKGKANNCSNENEGVSPPKKFKKNLVKDTKKSGDVKLAQKGTKKTQNKDTPDDISNESQTLKKDLRNKSLNCVENNMPAKALQLRKTKSRNTKGGTIVNEENTHETSKEPSDDLEKQNKLEPPKITITNESNANVSSIYFEGQTSSRLRLSRKRTHSAESNNSQEEAKTNINRTNKTSKLRTKSAPGNAMQVTKSPKVLKKTSDKIKKQETSPTQQRISHKDLMKSKTKSKNDVTRDLMHIITNSMKEESSPMTKGTSKGKLKVEKSDLEDLDSDDNFKPTKLSPRPSTSKVIDRRVLSSDEDTLKRKIDVWCEIFVEELEQWICVDIITGKIHDPSFLYNRSTHPVCYIVGWDNNNYLKDVTRRYVPHWNTVTRKLRAEQPWWNKALQPWLGPKTARDREEDEFLDKQQLEAPLPKSIAEYKNHPLYALKRHLLKFEAIYPPEAASLGFVRGEPVYARDCVYVCRSRDTWLKEAKVVRLGEIPYKVVKARPKWDKSSNKLITDKPLEVFGPWQVQDYEPPVAENGIVPRNAYGNVELFKQCMLPKGTVHIKLPGLNKVARKLNIDCAPAMTGFEFNGGWSHPVYDGFVVCKEFEEVITEAWVADQEEQEKREREKTDARVYGNWKKLIKGLLIRERIKTKYGFENPSTSQPSKNKTKAPRYVAKKK